MKTITLVKTVTGFGRLPRGHKYPWTYKASNESVAHSRAFRALKRDHPDENPAEWTVAPPEELKGPVDAPTVAG